MQINLTFRKACKEDLPFLLALRQETMDPHILGAGLIPSESNHMERINYHFDKASILLIDNIEAGLLKVVKEGPAWDLVQIQLKPLFQGLGIGRRVIAQVLEEAFSKDASVKLSVFKENPAKNLYDKLGFKIYLETEKTYEMQANP